MVNSEITSKGKRTALSLLDIVTQQQEQQERHKENTATHNSTAHGAPRFQHLQEKLSHRGKNETVAPFALRYRVQLLKIHRAATWKTFLFHGRLVTFDIWRACQLRLILLLAHMAIQMSLPAGAGGGVGGGGGGGCGSGGLEDEAGAGSEDRWKVKGEVRDYSTLQLMQTMVRIAEEAANTSAPSPELWNTYCEDNYSVVLVRLEHHLAAVRQRFPWVDSYGPLSVHMLEYLMATGCFDESACPITNRDDVVGLLRTVREATDMSEGVEVAALAVTCLRMYLHSRDLDTLLLAQQHLERMQTLPDSAFNTSKSRSGGYIPPRREQGLAWYKVASLEEVLSSLRVLLSDAHSYFINPIDEIPVAVQVFVMAHALLKSANGAPASALSSEEEVCTCLKASVRARFSAIVDAQARPDGTVNVEGCIDAVTNLAEEVEVEALYFAPGYISMVPRAAGIAVLEYIICCKQSVEDSVQSFRTLSGDAVRLWRALSALQNIIGRLVPEDCKEEAVEALTTLAGLSKLFDRCVQSWMDDQASRYAEVLANCIELEKTQKWATLQDSGVSSSVVDLFHMFHETVPQLFGLGLPLSRDDVLNCISQVDLFVMKYCNEIMTQHYKDKPFRMDPAGLIPQFQLKKDALDKMTGQMQELFTQEGRQAARERKELTRAPKGQEDTMKQKMQRSLNVFSASSNKSPLVEESKSGASPIAILDKAGQMTGKAVPSCVCHDWFRCVAWRIEMCGVTYRLDE